MLWHKTWQAALRASMQRCTANQWRLPPSDFVTWCTCDFQGSTELWEWNPDVMNHALAMHDALMRSTLHACGGYEVRPCRLQVLSLFAMQQPVLRHDWRYT